MDQQDTWAGRRIYHGARALTGRCDDYINPVAGVAGLMHNLLKEYVEDGGDLEKVQLTVSLEQYPTVARKHVVVQLHGYDRQED